MNEHDMVAAEAAAKADAARQLIENKTLLEAFSRLRDRYISEWESSDIDEAQVQTRAKLKLAALGDLRADLDAQIASARVVVNNLKSKLTRL